MVLIPETFVAEIYSQTYSLKELQDLLEKWVEEYEKFGLKTNKIVIKWKANQTKNLEANISEERQVSKSVGMELKHSSKRFEAILHQVKKLRYGEAGISTLREIPESISFMVAQEAPFVFSPGVFGKIQIDKKSENNSESVENFSAVIYSQTKSLRELQCILEDWVEVYEKFERDNAWNELKFYGNMKGYGRQFNYSVKLLAILHQLEKLGKMDPRIKVLKEFAREEERQHYYSSDNPEHRKTQQLIPEMVEVGQDIFCEVSTNVLKSCAHLNK